MMENSNENITNKKGNGSLIIIVILSIAVLALGGYICYDKLLSNNNDSKQTESNKEYNDNNVKDTEEKENNNDSVIDNSANLDFDFNELSNTLHSSVKKDNITTFVSRCESKTTNTNEPPETEQKNTEVSSNTIDTIINKLKTAKSIDKEITYSWFGCPPRSITYYVSANSTNSETVHSQRVFSLNYADGNDMLLVGYNNKGYAFHFNSSEEINNFIESLK